MPAERASGWLAVRDYEVDTELTGGETLDVAGIAFEVVAIPGHSPDHVAFYSDGCLFSGDLLFAGIRRARRSRRRRLGRRCSSPRAR